MLLKIIRNLFRSTDEKDKVKSQLEPSPIKEVWVEKGKFETITCPKVNNTEDLILVKWLVRTGDIVKSGDIICEMETEKATMEFESFYCGKIHTKAKVKDKLQPGSIIGQIEGIR